MTLSIDSLSAGYGKAKVISGISLQVAPGTLCAVMGRNGSGKTTLLHCITKVLAPLEGSIFIHGKNIRRISPMRAARMVSLVPQASFSPFAFSCLDMVLMAGASRVQPWSRPNAKERHRALAALDETGAGHLARNPFNRLSGGERQLVLIARGLFQDAPVILLDEPTAHLDFANQHRIMRLTQKLVKQKNLTAVVTLHDPNLTLLYADDVMMIKNGKKAAHGKTRDIMTDGVLSDILGDNIRCCQTLSGTPVVTPKHIPLKFQPQLTR